MSTISEFMRTAAMPTEPLVVVIVNGTIVRCTDKSGRTNGDYYTLNAMQYVIVKKADESVQESVTIFNSQSEINKATTITWVRGSHRNFFGHVLVGALRFDRVSLPTALCSVYV